MIKACREGDLNTVKSLVEKGYKVTRNYDEPLRTASSRGHLEIVKYLVQKGSNPTMEHPRLFMTGNNAIWNACAAGHLEVLKFFLDPSPSMEIKPGKAYSRKSLCFYACYMGHLHILKYLSILGKLDLGLVIIASEHGRLDLVKYFVSLGSKVTCQDNYAIRRASSKGHLDVVKYLLEQGSDFNKLTNEHKRYFFPLKAFRRWRMVVFRRFFRKVVIPLYYSPGFPGACHALRELADCVRPERSLFTDEVKAKRELALHLSILE